MEQREVLIGTVDRLLFENSENGFTIFVITHHSNNQPIIVKGYTPKLHPGQRVEIEGAWVMHPKFGKQFDASSCNAKDPVTQTGLVKYLGSGLIKGIGPAYAEKLVSYFGKVVLEVIDLQPERLHSVPGIGPKRAATIIAGWQEQKAMAGLMVFLQDKDVSAHLAAKIYKKYGAQAQAVIKENPYRIADEIWGVGFKTADQIAQKLGMPLNSIARIKAGIMFVLTSVTQKGHLYKDIEETKDETITLLGLNTDDRLLTKQALHMLHEEQKIIVITHATHNYIALRSHYYAEKGVAEKLLIIQKQTSRCTFPIHELYNQLRTQQHSAIQLNDDQQRGIITCLQNKITIITGGPGTGKTTLIKQLLVLLDQQSVRYKLAAPTGRAAKRMQESTGKYAATIHRLLEFDVSIMGFKRNEHNALDLDFIIIDESSMVDVFLAHALLKAIPFHAHIVFIGDIDQLPSVGAGNILRDMIRSTIIPTIKLSMIFRQANDSLIVTNAHRINQGEFPVGNLPNTRNDFIFIKEDDAEQITKHVHTIFTKTLYAYNIHPNEAIVLSPMHRGSSGTQAINHYLQQLLNTKKSGPQITYAGTTFFVDDKVMQIKNNYDKLVFNGDAGSISAINVDDQTIEVHFGDHTVLYERDEFDELTLAYASSIHKSQGSEYTAVIVPIFMHHFTLLQRNLLYTAITRAKKLCIFVGQPKAIGMAINNNKEQKRITLLNEFLTSTLSAR